MINLGIARILLERRDRTGVDLREEGLIDLVEIGILDIIKMMTILTVERWMRS